MAKLTRAERARKNASEGMKRSALKRQCPACKRKGAVSKRWDGDYVERNCRYCGWGQGRYVNVDPHLQATPPHQEPDDAS